MCSYSFGLPEDKTGPGACTSSEEDSLRYVPGPWERMVGRAYGEFDLSMYSRVQLCSVQCSLVQRIIRVPQCADMPGPRQHSRS